MRHNVAAPLALSLIALVLGGCPAGDEERPNSTTVNYVVDEAHVFSDNDESIGYIERSYDVTTSGVAPFQSQVYSNRTYKVMVANAAGNDAKVVGPTVNGLADRLYLMQGAGYALVREVTDAAFIVKVLDLDTGSYRELTRDGTQPCDSNIFRAIPSPQGDIIAVARWDSTSACSAEEPVRVSIELLDAVDGELLAPKEVVTFDNLTLKFTWRGDEAFVVSDLTKSIEVSEDGFGGEVRQPGCFYPETTSSPIAANGTEVSFASPNIVLSNAQSPSFGCQ